MRASENRPEAKARRCYTAPSLPDPLELFSIDGIASLGEIVLPPAQRINTRATILIRTALPYRNIGRTKSDRSNLAF
ncbi:MAG: hypothetical protein J2P41_11740 [Blastocatellia bacterium]|nr:hypothetical protein [Blastocatellia bacterium]